MTVKYEYKSACCGHEYSETRVAEEPLFFPVCTSCGNADYELVKETIISDVVERTLSSETIEPLPEEPTE